MTILLVNYNKLLNTTVKAAKLSLKQRLGEDNTWQGQNLQRTIPGCFSRAAITVMFVEGCSCIQLDKQSQE